MPPPPAVLAQYQVVAARRQAFDTMMWQAPALSLTAQSFLLSLAYGAQSTRLASAVAGVLSVIVSGMSVQLLLRHRQNEITDSLLLHRIELEQGWPEMFASSKVRARTVSGPHRRLVRGRSYLIWACGLSIFGIAGLLAFVRAVL
ncbi:hypothetical protein AB0K14_19085 [Actinosynnema sp. NPDC050801]|uniref:hypothetical protein n=1 Tax=unclassified Actinosynnema TaxID=2637065 RepID=UPI0033C4C865